MSIGAMVPQTGLKGTGVLLPVVGPEDTGQTALIASARAAYSGHPAIVFAETITSSAQGPAGAGRCVNRTEFSALKAAGAFAVSWQGQNRDIGVPATIFDDLTAGRVVVVSVARAVIADLRRRHSRVHVIYLTTPRTAGAQNPDPAAVIDIPEPPVTVIDNSGPRSEAVEEFLGVLESYVPMSG